MEKELKVILFAKESWMNSQLSIAKYSGCVQVLGEGGKKRTFFIVNKEGKDLTQAGISEGEPADLVDKEFIPLYKKLGRTLFIGIVQANPLASRKELKDILTEQAKVKALGEKAEKQARTEKEKRQNPSLFD